MRGRSSLHPGVQHQPRPPCCPLVTISPTLLSPSALPLAPFLSEGKGRGGHRVTPSAQCGGRGVVSGRGGLGWPSVQVQSLQCLCPKARDRLQPVRLEQITATLVIPTGLLGGPPPAPLPWLQGKCHFSVPSDALSVGEDLPGKGVLFSGSAVSDSAAPWTVARQASLSFTVSSSLSNSCPLSQ